MQQLTEQQQKLVEDNIRLAYYMARKWKSQLPPRKIDQEELASLCTLALCKAARSFDEEKGVKFATYAARCMDNEVLMTLRKNKNNWRLMSLEQVIAEDPDGKALTIQDLLFDPKDDIEQWLLTETIPNLLDILKDRERTILERIYFGDEAQRNIGTELGLSQSYVSRIRRRALKRIKQEALKDHVTWL